MTRIEADIVVIGGGINGSGIARDAAGRGFNVVLCEKGDLANATSSASSKLIHGGLRYLEQYEFGLVRGALAERETLLRIAPHIVRPLRFVLPHNAGLRPSWMIRCGLFLYDHLSRRSSLPGSHGIKLRTHPAGHPLDPTLSKGFEYSDCWVDDSRLTVLNALDATERGATVLVRHEVIAARHDAGRWIVEGRNDEGPFSIHARALVNAAGPWAGEMLGTIASSTSRQKPTKGLRLIKGSHIVVPRIGSGEFAYIFQHPDGRVIFVLPFEVDYSIIGTTDIAFKGDPADVKIDQSEIEYLCAAVNQYLASSVSPDDVVWSYSGVRALYDDGTENPSSVTRDYVLDLQGGREGVPPVLSVLGGKITTYRLLAEEAMSKLVSVLGKSDDRWTANAALPGGDIEDGDMGRFRYQLEQDFAFLDASTLDRIARSYGTLSKRFLQGATCIEDMGTHYGCGLYEREVEYLVTREWATNAADVLWRRTKLGLHMTQTERQMLDARFAEDAALDMKQEHKAS